MNKERIKKAALSAGKSLYKTLPILTGAVLLISLASAISPKSVFSHLLNRNLFLDPVLSALLGSISAGNPITSYVLGGEFLKMGISLVAVTSFLVTWVTVGLVQLPAEIFMFGKKFAITRNILSFVFAIIIAIIVTIILKVIL